uniref:Uncharacterized protein n=1 Tax=Globodera pallida TaxID=36090 RepID=A0A183BXJ5_GLOPA
MKFSAMQIANLRRKGTENLICTRIICLRDHVRTNENVPRNVGMHYEYLMGKKLCFIGLFISLADIIKTELAKIIEQLMFARVANACVRWVNRTVRRGFGFANADAANNLNMSVYDMPLEQISGRQESAGSAIKPYAFGVHNRTHNRSRMEGEAGSRSMALLHFQRSLGGRF